MIDDLDEALRQLFVRELPIKNGEVDVKFDQPKRDWAARLSRPTLNLFLYDLCENKKLRQAQPMWELDRNDNGSFTRRRKPVRVDLRYMITSWANEPEDEHRLLSRALMSLLLYPHLPLDLLPESLQNQPVPIPMMVAQQEELTNPADLWSAMDNELRPAIICVITIALDPYQPVTGPLVRTREIRFGQSGRPELQQLDEETEPERFWTIGGTIRSSKPLEEMELSLVEPKLEVPLQPEGRFSVGNLKEGEYTLDVSVKGRRLNSFKLTVPSSDYDLEI